MKKFLLLLSITGWLLALFVHLTALVGDYDLSGPLPYIWFLHVGIFIVFAPAVLILKNEPDLESRFSNIITFFRFAFKNTPRWMSVLLIASFLYAVINFSLFLSSQPGMPDIKDGQFILNNHGSIVKVLTEKEYRHFRANQLRGFSGHWMVFYGFSATIYYLLLREKD